MTQNIFLYFPFFNQKYFGGAVLHNESVLFFSVKFASGFGAVKLLTQAQIEIFFFFSYPSTKL